MADENTFVVGNFVRFTNDPENQPRLKVVEVNGDIVRYVTMNGDIEGEFVAGTFWYNLEIFPG